MHDHRPPSRLGRRLAILGGTTALVAAGWATTATASSAPPADTAAAAPVAINVTLTDSGIEGLPADLAAGLVEVTVDDQTEGAGGDDRLHPRRARHRPCAVRHRPRHGLRRQALPGLPPRREGHRRARDDRPAGGRLHRLDRPRLQPRPRVDRRRHQGRAVDGRPGERRRDDPAVRRRPIRAGDYLFDVDVVAGGSTVTFTNTSDNQFHHVLLVDFGTNDPAARRGGGTGAARRRRQHAATRGHRPVAGERRIRRVGRDGAGQQRHVRRDVRVGAHLRRAVLRLRRRRAACRTPSSTTCTRCSRSPEAPRASPPAPVWCRRRCTASW